jgi:hypothetical protein
MPLDGDQGLLDSAGNGESGETCTMLEPEEPSLLGLFVSSPPMASATVKSTISMIHFASVSLEKRATVILSSLMLDSSVACFAPCF